MLFEFPNQVTAFLFQVYSVRAALQLVIFVLVFSNFVSQVCGVQGRMVRMVMQVEFRSQVHVHDGFIPFFLTVQFLIFSQACRLKGMMGVGETMQVKALSQVLGEFIFTPFLVPSICSAFITIN